MSINYRSIFCMVLLFTLFAFSGEYYSNNVFESDKIAFVWIVKKYVDKDARFYFLDRDQTREGAIPFDLPTAKYRRYAKYSTAMSLVKFNNIKDTTAIKLASLIDEIELDFWSGQKSEKAKNVENNLRSIIEKEKDPQKIIEKSIRYIDSIVDSL